MKKLLAAVVLAFASSSGSVSAAPPAVQLSAAPGAEVVYNWSKDRCADDILPDSPARGYRRGDGSIVVMAANANNSILQGPSFQSLKPNCQTRSVGQEDPDPSHYNDRIWVEALMKGEGDAVIALISHEYLGQRHPGHCTLTSTAAPQCWYSSILLATARDPDFKFSLTPIENRIIAAAATPFSRDQVKRVGFFTTSNIVRKGEYAYFFSWAEEANFSGNCLFRTKAASPQGPWLALHGGQFNQKYGNPYKDASSTRGQGCDRIGAADMGPMRSVVFLEKQNKFVGVYAVAAGPGKTPGIYYSTSADLLTWSDPEILFKGSPWYGTNACGEFFDYPSLIDHESSSPEFGTAGNALYLYLTRYNWQSCKKEDRLNRDLVRVKVSIGGAG